MRRSVLLTLALVGALVSVVGGVGLFAVLSDSATTGTNSAQSPGLTGSADLQIAIGSEPAAGATQIDCGTYSDDLASGLFDLANVPKGYMSPFTYVCVRNLGSQTVALNLEWAFELTDADIACTGDEVSSGGDNTCGELGGVPQQGELAPRLETSVMEFGQCDVQGQGPETWLSLGGIPGSLHALGTLGPTGSAPRCFAMRIRYDAFTTTTAQEQAAQSDRVTWRYRFFGNV